MSAVDEFFALLDSVDERDPLYHMDYSIAGTVPYPRAHIATDMVPRVQPFLKDGKSEILIVGNDGENITSEGYPWTENLIDWAARGNRVKYLLVKPTEKAVTRLRAACSELGAAEGSLEILSIDADLEISDTDRKFIDRWSTFHFVTFDNPKQLWVEENHPEGSTEAENCTYYPPDVANETALWGILKRQFELITSKYGTTLVSSNNLTA